MSDPALGFNQNPVFSIANDDGASTPGRDRQSPSHGRSTVISLWEHRLTNTGSARGRGKLAKSLIERDYPSDTDRTRSASPPNSVYNTAEKVATPNMRINTLLNDDGPASSPAPKGPGRGNWSRNRHSGIGASGGGPAARSFKTRLDAPTASQDGQSPSTSAPTFNGPHGFYLPLNGSDPSHKRTRPLTQHQLAVEQYRRRRVDVILDRGIRIEYKAAAKRRRKGNAFMRSWIRCKGMGNGYDTDEETYTQHSTHVEDMMGAKTPPLMPAGLVPLDFGGEINDHGEESYFRAKMLSRALRRLDRWEGGKGAPRKVERSMERERDVRPVYRSEEDEDEEDMMDVDERGGDEESDEESEDEDMENERARWDPHALPPLPRMA